MTGAEFECCRVRMGLTRVRLAELLGYTRFALRGWVNGVYPVPRAVGLAMLTLERMYPAGLSGRRIRVYRGVAEVRA